MASLNPPIVDDLSQLALPQHAVIVGFSDAPGGREVLLGRRDGMHLDVSEGYSKQQCFSSFVLVHSTGVLS